MESINDASYAVDKEWRFTYLNRKAEQWWGRKREDLVGKIYWEEFPEAVGSVPYHAHFQAMREQRAIRLEAICPSMDRWIDCEIIPNAAGGLSVYFHDITNRKETEVALRTLNDTLEARVADRTHERDRTWRLAPVLMVVGTLEGVLQAVNPAWTKVLGWTADETVGRRDQEFVAPADLEETAIRDQLARGEPVVEYQNEWMTKTGERRRIAWTVVREGDTLYGFGRDVTDQLATEEQLRQAQKMEAVGQLTGGVAHDFNNLLTVIRGSVELLMRPNVPEERRVKYISAIADTATRATKLTNQLLAFARRQALRPEVFNVGESVLLVCEMVETLTGARIHIETHLPDDPCFINADPSQFDTALVNLAVNGRDAMEGEGRIIITVQAVSTMPSIRSQPVVRGDFVAVSLTDTGSGIPPEKLDQIFEPFFTTKEVGQGTGLGLSQVFGFTKQSGGEVQVVSEPGQGSTFTLYLPRAAAAAPPRETIIVQPLVDGHGAWVLVVEDNASVGAFSTQTLQELGYNTVLAIDGSQALAELAKDASRFDVVFSDVIMPGMNGVELAQEIRRLYDHLPVLLTSGYSHGLGTKGASDFKLLHKPYSIEQLSRVLMETAARLPEPRNSLQ